MGKKKKKSARDDESRTSMMEALGLSRITQIFMNERLRFFIGTLLFAVSGCMVFSFISFFTTGQADMSIIENLRTGELANQNGEFHNACGSLGAYTSYFFIKQCFGVPAFFIPVFMLLVSLRLLKAFKPNLLKWFMCLMLVMIWTSIALAKFVAPLFGDYHFCLGGDHGLMVGRWIEGFVGVPGLAAVLIIIAVLFLSYI
ncbi:MAG: DNA translocase FtsK 4TM domain-containing protein, partial [Prevotella sp.]